MKDEELTSHLFNSRTPYEPGDDRDIWCRDCEYHRDHAIHNECPTCGGDLRGSFPQCIDCQVVDALKAGD